MKEKQKTFFIKPVMIGLSTIGIAIPFLTVNVETQAATGGKTATQAITWVKSNVGKGIDFDGVAGNQCVDLIKAYYSHLGQKQAYGNGSGYVTNATPSGWDRIKGAKPQKGDILVYTGGYGGYGHVAIYESDYSHYHQNWNGHSYVERVTYNYKGDYGITYWGVIRPDFKKESSNVSTNSSSSNAKPTSSATTSSSFTGVKYVNGKWTYLKKGKADYSFTGVAKSTTGNWIFVKNGYFSPSFTGVAKSTTGNWIFVKNGYFSPSFTGVAKSTTGNWIFVKNGYFSPGFTGVAKSTTGNWVYVKNGYFSPGFTGVAKSPAGNWVYLKNGRLNTSYTGVAKSTTGNWIFVKNGYFSPGFTGVAKSTTGNWVYVKNGRFDSSFKGVSTVYNSTKKYYIVNGRWNKSFTGKYGKYNIKNGIVV